MEQLLLQFQLKYYATIEYLYAEVLLYYPRYDNYNPFQKFIIINLAIIAAFLIISFISSISILAIYRRIVKFVFSIGPVRQKVASQLELARDQILKGQPKDLLPTLDKIPYKTPDIRFEDLSEKQALKGKLSGSRYAVQNHTKFTINLAKLFSYSNPLHSEMFPFVKQMENQVIQMTAELIGLKDEKGKPCGTSNTGGTESIIMAIFAYREYKMKNDGVLKPNLVVCSTGHVASLKACDYLNIQMRLVPFNNNYEMDVGKMKGLIDENTICVYTSYPNYPYGTCDPIHIIGPYCKRRNIPVHVDMCLGGFVCPFLDKDWKLPEGITSVSADPHKYGLAAKGISILLYSSNEYRKCQFFVTSYWPGGLYGTPGISGSRTGVYIASAWISIMKLGVKGYEQNARQLSKTTTTVAEELRKLDFQILGNPNICIVSFKHKRYSVNSVLNFMKERGWGLALLQNPLAIHFSFTPINCLKRDEMIKDFKQCIEHLKKTGETGIKEDSNIQLYGACAKIPDVGTKHEILCTILDTFIDLS